MVVVFFRKPPESRDVPTNDSTADDSIVLRRSPAQTNSARRLADSPLTSGGDARVSPSLTPTPPPKSDGLEQVTKSITGVTVPFVENSLLAPPSLTALSPPEAPTAQSVEPRLLVTREPSPTRFHRIADGDTLEKIAEQHLGSASRANEIFSANRNQLVQPDLLPLGVRLVIPPEMLPIDPPASGVASYPRGPNGHRPTPGSPSPIPESRPAVPIRGDANEAEWMPVPKQ